MAGEGSVKFMFKQVGNIEILTGEKNIDEIEMMAIEAGAEDVIFEKDFVAIYTKVSDLQKVKENLEKAGLKVKSAGLFYVPIQKIEIDSQSKNNYENLLEKLDEHDDVQEIYDNL